MLGVFLGSMLAIIQFWGPIGAPIQSALISSRLTVSEQQLRLSIKAFLRAKFSGTKVALKLSSKLWQMEILAFTHDLSPRGFWENEVYVLGYGKTSKGHLVAITWKKDSSSPERTVEEVIRIFLDDRFAVVEKPNQMAGWEKERMFLIGSLLDTKRGYLKAKTLRARSDSQVGFDEKVGPFPTVIRLSAGTPVKSLLSSLGGSSSEN